MLLRRDLLERGRASFLAAGQLGIDLLIDLVTPLLINSGEPGKYLVFAIVAQQHRAIPDFKGNGVKSGIRHLAGDEAGIDQLIKLILVIRQILLDAVGGSRGIRRPGGSFRRIGPR